MRIFHEDLRRGFQAVSVEIVQNWFLLQLSLDSPSEQDRFGGTVHS